ncbi:MAG: integrase core domain-containing protein [Halioglobus sp.]|nr:integrase core domain-containing protein [Halioglobus sp.]
MRDVFFLLFHLLIAITKLVRPGGSRAVIAENLLLKRQLIIHSRSRKRAPNLATRDRTVLGFLSMFLNPRRLVRSEIIIKPSTLLALHKALKKQKYRLLYSPRGGRKPGPKGPSSEVIRAIVEMKQRNPRHGCPRIAQQISLALCANVHRFVERLIGSVREDLLDQTFFWTATDLENKPRHYQHYYNEHRCHSSREGDTPVPSEHGQIVNIDSHRWNKHCRGVFNVPETNLGLKLARDT